MALKHLIILSVCAWHAASDLYLHNPRGSNNRLDESGRERHNANRLFDSQNNNRGGYNVGSLYYYVGSKLNIEWTNQHSCQDPNNHCELVLQYMCSPNVRDGATTSTIPENPMDCEDYNCNRDTRYGMHEDHEYYMTCRSRQRNMGLYTADQKLDDHHRNRAKNTRQNPNGNRRGYECPEERDYYPYWHPTPWRDIGILTNDATRCPYYQEHSENVKGRWSCVIPHDILVMNFRKNLIIPNNEEDCNAFRWPTNDPNGTRAVWTESPSHGLPAPVCRETEFTRDNHLGNGPGGYPNLFNWTIPNAPAENCVIRMRYNISTNDYDAWEGVNSTHNKARNRRKDKGVKVDLYRDLGFDSPEEADDRGYEFKNNPEVQIFPGLEDLKFRLAINTAQFGRTFQDRSHTFAVRETPEHLKDGTIYNLNVRGKRGNIVQVYPAVEYDFVPNTLEIPEGDYIHFQWTGSNTNPNNNDGQGRAGTDRSNVVLMRTQIYPKGSGNRTARNPQYGYWSRSYPETASNITFMGLSETDIMDLALLTPGQFRGEMSELDDAGTYFDLGPRKVTKTGTYHYLSTRNNNFSNRSQKGKIIVTKAKVESESIGWNGGELSVNNGKAKVRVERGTFSELQKMKMESWEPEVGEALIKERQKEIPVGNDFASPFVVIHPEQQIAVEGKTFEVNMEVDQGGLNDVAIYRTSSNSFATWTRMDVKLNGGKAAFQTQNGGVYVAVKQPKAGIIAATVIGVLLVIAVIIVGAVLYVRRYPKAFSGITRSFQNKV